MAWQEVETDVGAGGSRCFYSVHLKHGGARISVPQAVAEALKWTVKTRFKLQVGAADSEGHLRVVAADDGKISGKAPPKGKGLLIRLGRWKSLAPRNVDKVHVDHELQPDQCALVVKLPLHALAIAPVKAVEGTKPAAGSGKVDVSSQFFNDPKRNTGRPVSRPPT